MKEYSLFKGRYTVVIGQRGGIKVISNVAHGKELKVNGKQKDKLRYVNLTVCKGGSSAAYCLDSIKQYCLGGSELHALTEDEVLCILKKTSPPALLESSDKIGQLMQGLDRYNNTCFIEELEHYKRYYSKSDFTRQSNGLLKYNYRVTTVCNESNSTTTSTTQTFTYIDKVTFTDVTCISNTELGQIFTLVNDERIKRKLKVFSTEFNSINKDTLKGDYDYHTYCESNL